MKSPQQHQWQVATLSSLIEASKDGEWGKGDDFDTSVLMRAIRGTDFAEVRVGLYEDVPKRHIAGGAAERKKLMPNDIVIEAAGGTKNKPTGRTVFINERLINSSDLPFICASFSRFIRINQEKADPLFVFWYLQYLYESGRLTKYHTQHTGVGRFQWTVFKESPDLSLPHLVEQKRIASILGTFDDLIENNARRLKILEEMAKQIFREWFVFYRFPEHKKVKMVNSRTELGSVPEKWPIKAASEAIDINPHTRMTDAESYFISMDGLSTSSMLISNVQRKEASSGARYKNGDTLFARITPCLENGKTGFVQFLPNYV